jgi:hypothetical protein
VRGEGRNWREERETRDERRREEIKDNSRENRARGEKTEET